MLWAFITKFFNTACISIIVVWDFTNIFAFQEKITTYMATIHESFEMLEEDYYVADLDRNFYKKIAA